MRVRVKICGITNLDDALVAAEAGADAIGFVFYRRSPRFVEPERAAEIAWALPPFVDRVGVFVNASRADIARIADECGLTAVQLHGEEPPELCEGWRVPVIKALRTGADGPHPDPSGYPGARAFLVDAHVPSARGGTGNLADWGIARELARRLRVILAGGLTAQNVGEAIRVVRPYAVDVSSGVEIHPGVKDPGKIAAFLEAVRKVSSELEVE